MDLVTGAIGSIISKLAELLAAEYKLQAGVKQRIQSLTRELESAHAFLQEIDKVPPDQLNKQVKIWACEVREASYDMEDVLDTFLIHAKDPKPVNKNKNMLKRLKEKIDTLFSKTMARHDIANAIEEVNKKLKEIAERRQRYKINDCVASPATPSSCIDPRIAPLYSTSASMLIGIDESKEAVIRMLSHDDMKTRVVSVLGFGGLGKTTLAKATYDQLKQNYECGAFVSVGRNPDLVKVFKDILYDLDKVFRDIHSTQKGADLLIRELLDFLRDKRYLIVIDDVWETQSKKRIIDQVLSTQNNKGSRIIITTRNSEVATGDEVYKYKLQPLSDDNSKELFYARIPEDKCPDNQRPKVSEVVDKILKKCGGVPLAIITMASLLVGKSMQEWFEVCNSIGFRDKDKEQVDDTLWILSLSYYDLPSHLKTCLLYLSLFPEDYLIKKDALIWMWVAEGFVNEKPGIGLYEIGEGYFNNLVNRSLIQPVEDEETRIINGCRIHDMILDLIRSLSREANFAMVFDNRTEDTLLGSNARRLALHNDAPLNNHTDTARARSFFAFMRHSVPMVQFRSFKLLRVLYLDGSFHRLPFYEHIGDLLHLRYLGTSRSSYEDLELPKEAAFKFLRVLYLDDNILSASEHPRELLPSSVGMLTQLVCLRAVDYSLPGEEIKNLTSLQELHIRPGTWGDEKSIGQFVKDLGNLRELRALRIFTGHFKDKRMQSDFVNSLGNLHNLQRLQLFGASVTIEDGEGARENKWQLPLPLPRGLCHLVLDTVPELPPCIDPTRLPNLSHLTLTVDEMGDQGLKILGELPELHYLKLTLSTRCRSKATITGTAAHGYFQKLRSCELPFSTVQFVVNEDSSVSFTISTRVFHHSQFRFKKKQDNCRVAGALMPNLEVLSFRNDVEELTDCNLGLECLPSLQKLTVVLLTGWGLPDDVANNLTGRVEAALRHTIQAHPNRPTLEIDRYDYCYNSSESDNDDSY
ncbi:disease resistance protein RPP13 isoform X1 [Setaria viridis]|uniref:AAA+ ATPase domain-containing protein n=1 Tax=Setaria viridis TaxID=4556 RepID=A0A4V6D3E1_SETVI|nr:disease resistance protein PIK6-NP-like isoform X1 [Setaria viridis]TKW02366.1 hypothetical protein SEVIR_8G238800v2 [Setaria viridis]